MAGSRKAIGAIKRSERKQVQDLRGAGSEDAWLWDPKTTDLVKSRVDDKNLVRMRRSQFVHTAIKIFCVKGYYATTVKEIADEANVSAGLIYQYITDKEDILFLALQSITHTLKLGLPEAIFAASTPIDRYIAAYEKYCRVVDANRDACMLTYRETKSLSREHRGVIKSMEIETNELIAACVQECISADLFREVNVQLFVYQTIMVAHTWALKNWRLSQLTNIDEYIRTNCDTLLHSVLTPKGKKFLDSLRSGSDTKVASLRSKRSSRTAHS